MKHGVPWPVGAMNLEMTAAKVLSLILSTSVPVLIVHDDSARVVESHVTRVMLRWISGRFAIDDFHLAVLPSLHFRPRVSTSPVRPLRSSVPPTPPAASGLLCSIHEKRCVHKTAASVTEIRSAQTRSTRLNGNDSRKLGLAWINLLYAHVDACFSIKGRRNGA